MARLGNLEKNIMDILWDSQNPVSAKELLEEINKDYSKKLAITTVLTVLSRLESKNLVIRNRAARPHLYSPSASRSDHTAQLIHQVLNDSQDRAAVLTHFVGNVSSEEAVLLRKLLEDNVR
ncbi:MAG: BlaI/MecI/CopY family transcriptional regulator [Micrococcaceae bacterium]